MRVPTFTLRAAWPILDDSLTLTEAIAEATADLDDLAARHGVHVVGTPEWHIRPGDTEPGWSAWDHVLIAEVRAVGKVAA